MDDTRLYIEHRQCRQHVVLFTWEGARLSFQVNEYIGGTLTNQKIHGDPDKARNAAARMIADYYMEARDEKTRTDTNLNLGS